MPPLNSTSTSSTLIGLLRRNRGLIFPLACAGLILVVLFPLPPWMIDILLVGNLTLAAIILFTSIQVSDPLEFSVFPSLLLGTTLVRLVLNVATTRLILTAGSNGAPPIVATTAAGEVIRSFGHFVTSGSLAVGFVIFTILVVIQFVVITKGATRISEVAARFTLDSMPGKQMAVDADLNAGLINESQAAARRETIARESNFYGAMDGASKFVRGDAIAAVIITLVNIIGGLCVGLLQHGWSLSDTLTVFTTLTIGDGLVSQLPAFIIAVSAGLIITRSTGRSDLGREMVDQLFGRPGALVIATIFLALLLITGLPKFPLLILGGCLLVITWSLRKSDAEQPAEFRSITANSPAGPGNLSQPPMLISPPTCPELTGASAEQPQSGTAAYLRFEPLEIEVGFSLLPLLDTSAPGNLLAHIEAIRRDLAARLGFLVPGVFAHDNVRIPARDYIIKVRGLEVLRGRIHPGKLLAVAPGFSTERLDGLALTDPLTQRPAFWIPHCAQDSARQLGYTIISSDRVLPRHLRHIIYTHADQLLTRQAVHNLLADLAQRAGLLVAELIGYDPRHQHRSNDNSKFSVARIHKVLQELLAQGIPICDLESILEALSDALALSSDPADLTSRVRCSLAPIITREFTASDGRLHCLLLDPSAEQTICRMLHQPQINGFASAADQHSLSACLSKLADHIVDYVHALPALPEPLVFLVASEIRPALAPVLAGRVPALPVLARSEILGNAHIYALASFSLPQHPTDRPALLTQQTLELFS